MSSTRMDRTAGEILIPVNGGEAYGLQGKVEICGVNTAKLKVLKNEETTELLKRTKQGDMAAREGTGLPATCAWCSL